MLKISNLNRQEPAAAPLAATLSERKDALDAPRPEFAVDDRAEWAAMDDRNEFREVLGVPGRHALGEAARVSDLALLERLLAAGADPNVCCAPPETIDGLPVACADVVPANFNYLLTPLALAVARNCIPAIEALLEAGADPRIHFKPTRSSNGLVGFNPPPIYLVSSREAAALLLRAGSPADYFSEMRRCWGSPLTRVVEACLPERDKEEIVAELVHAGADANAPGRDAGCTPLLAALHCRSGARVVRRLLELGADPNLPDENGVAPLSVAANGFDVEALRALLAAGADPNRAEPGGLRPLHRAVDEFAAGSSFDLLRLLLEFGADPSAKDSTWHGPLHHAAMNGHVEGCALLLEAGADPDARSLFGETPLDLVGRRETRAQIEALFLARRECQELDELLSEIPVRAEARESRQGL